MMLAWRRNCTHCRCFCPGRAQDLNELPMTLRSAAFLRFTLSLLLPLFALFAGAGFMLLADLKDQLNQEMRDAVATMGRSISTAIGQDAINTLRLVAEKNLEIIGALHQQQLAGALTQDEARWLAASILTSQKIGENGYLFAFDSQGIIQAHPGRNLLRTKIAENVLSPQQRFQEDGLVHYQWHEPGSLVVQPMVLYKTLFKPWDWTIAATIGTAQIARMVPTEAIVKQLNRPEPQFAFLLDESGDFRFSPEALKTMPAGQQSALRGQKESLQTLKSGRMTFSWQKQAGETAEKDLLFFQQRPDSNDIAGIVIARDSLYAPHRALKLKIALLLAAALATTLLLCLLASHLMARPIRQLVQRIAPEKPSLEPLPPVPQQEELTQLTAAFNRLLGQLRTQAHLLAAGKEESQLAQQQFQQELISRKEMQQRLLAEINTRKSAENYLQLFKNLFDYAIEGVFITDPEARILTVNHSFSVITGYQPAEVIGQNPRILSSGKHGPDFYQQMWRSLKNRGAWSGEIWNRKKDGTIWPQWLSISRINNESGKITHYFAFFHDITELKRKEKQISIMAYSDALTKLPNRAALELRLAKALSRADRKNLTLAIFFIDLDNFKNINDSLGHDIGDQVLIEVAARLAQTIRTEDTLSRLGGDEFILLSENIENENAIYNLANRLLASLRRPIPIGPRPIYINASIGISIYPNDGRTIQELIKNADMAMYKAKGEGKNKFVMYTPEMNEKLQIRVRTENAIRSGLKQNDFVVYYQPKIELASERATSFEALLRWRHNDTIIGPDDFIPIAEETGLIDEMSLYVLDAVCLFLRGLQHSQLPVLPVSVNMSPRTFNNPKIVDLIDNILKSHKIDHKLIEFEITESTAMQDVQHTLATMQRFRQRGTSFSIDDFGTGYSSLSYLHEMPVSTLKIDKRFINSQDVNNRSIVSIITAMSKQMQLKVVAEGVETAQQTQWLRAIGCNEVQGFYFCHPMPEPETIHYLQNSQGQYIVH